MLLGLQSLKKRKRIGREARGHEVVITLLHVYLFSL